MLSNAAGSVDVGTLLGQAVGGGITGAIVTAVVGLIKNKKLNVRFGSLADIRVNSINVRFAPESGHFARRNEKGPLRCGVRSGPSYAHGRASWGPLGTEDCSAGRDKRTPLLGAVFCVADHIDVTRVPQLTAIRKS